MAPACRGPGAEKAAVSRLYGGIHFTSDNDTGLTLGRKVAKAAIDRYDVTGPPATLALLGRPARGPRAGLPSSSGAYSVEMKTFLTSE